MDVLLSDAIQVVRYKPSPPFPSLPFPPFCQTRNQSSTSLPFPPLRPPLPNKESIFCLPFPPLPPLCQTRNRSSTSLPLPPLPPLCHARNQSSGYHTGGLALWPTHFQRTQRPLPLLYWVTVGTILRISARATPGRQSTSGLLRDRTCANALTRGQMSLRERCRKACATAKS